MWVIISLGSFPFLEVKRAECGVQLTFYTQRPIFILLKGWLVK